MQNSLLVFGTENFNESLNEIEEYLKFSLIYYKKSSFLFSILQSVNLLLVDGEICVDSEVLNLINSIKNKPIMLLQKNNLLNINFNIKISLPSPIYEIQNKAINLIATKKFNTNSSIKIKEYLLDKNERKLKKENLSIVITEREAQLIELLFTESKPLSKAVILKNLWKYSASADTHTIETHVYRLRKKIFDKFKDENFIINKKNGYFI